MQNSKASGQFYKDSLLARLKSKDHISLSLGNIKWLVMSVLPRNPFLRNPFFFGIHFFGIPVFGIHFSASIFFRNPFFSESIFSESLVLESVFFRNPFSFGIHFFRIHFFRFHFCSEFIFDTWAKTRKMNVSENGCVSFLCGNGKPFRTHFFGATHFSVVDFFGGLWGN